MVSIPDFWTSLVLSCQTCFGSVLIFGILHTYPSQKPKLIPCFFACEHPSAYKQIIKTEPVVISTQL